MIDQIPRHAILSEEDKTMLAVAKQPNILISDVSQQTGLHPEILQHLVAVGALEGDKSICSIDQAVVIADRLLAARNRVGDNDILATEAASKYGFAVTTIYRWMNNGWILPVGGGQRRGRLFSERDIAFARELADITGYATGRSVFPSKPRRGRPKKAA